MKTVELGVGTGYHTYMPRLQRTQPSPLAIHASGEVLEYAAHRLPRYRGCDRVYLFHHLVFSALGHLADLRDASREGRRLREFASVRGSAVKLAKAIKPTIGVAVNQQTLERRCRFALRLYAEATGDDSVRSTYAFRR